MDKTTAELVFFVRELVRQRRKDLDIFRPQMKSDAIAISEAFNDKLDAVAWRLALQDEALRRIARQSWGTPEEWYKNFATQAVKLRNTENV